MTYIIIFVLKVKMSREKKPGQNITAIMNKFEIEVV